MGNWLSAGKERSCIFCGILQDIDKTETSTNDKVLAYNDTVAIFSDIKPAAEHHYLVVPRAHLSNTQTLHDQDHINLIEEMYEFGKNFLEEKVTPDISSDALYGFHMPPFISVDHLHLHVICPSKMMSFFSSHLFKQNSWYFVSPEEMIKKLNSRVST